jgi:phosphoserine aminotransferase
MQVDMCHWESFGKGWVGDVTSHLKLRNVTEHTAEYGELPDLSKTNPDHDIVFTWNGTTSGVCVPDANWIAAERKGLTFNDATSAVFAMDIDWPKVDVTTYSWQKVMGGEGAHGMLILSPRAVERIETFSPSESRPLPKIFRMAKKGKIDEALFKGSTINTPSMLCVEDYLDALAWADAEGGVPGLIARSQANLAAVAEAVEKYPWLDFLAKDPATRSSTSVCLTLDMPANKLKAMISWMENESIAYDIGAYRDAPDGLRVWCGATVEAEDVRLLMDWIAYGYGKFNA